MVEAYSKIITGYVTQQYLLNRQDNYVCIEQFFTATEEVSRTDENGDAVEVDTSIEIPQDTDMQQPRNMTFDEGYLENKKDDIIQSYYREIIEDDPDYPFCFKDWARQYYKESIEI